ncbi:DUF1289 domain-containing protein [Notoacmeibacter sp. MSK16QG-6]|uniref:DUF1289 domain-containing protein n=1 Tax=Notoacmeibacter sp. MSK16QG-6 TaxID=2957982 RepID=UPI0021118FA4|nr:DUF1289 domain-containing protein [Notoacmeibacter sp. MSK16QG-6]
MKPSPLSPCNRICTLDDKAHMCIGCGRTRSEIANWSAMDDRTRRVIMSQLPARMARAGIRPEEWQ